VDPKELERRFVYHPPTADTRGVHEQVREATLQYAALVSRLMEDESRETSLFFTNLEEASFWAHAHIARNRS